MADKAVGNLNRTKIEWATHTWNPLTGCKKGCPDCYARRLAETRLKHIYPRGFMPTVWPLRLEQPYKVKTPSIIFVCSMGELFNLDFIKRLISFNDFIWAVIKVVKENPHHTFIFLTQQPWNLRGYNFPKNAWIGVTVLKQRHLIDLRWPLRCNIGDKNIKFMSLEPLMEPIRSDWFGVDWLIVGGKTGPHKFVPPRKWVDNIIKDAKKQGIAVFLKDNLNYPRQIRQYPTLLKPLNALVESFK